MRLMAAPRVSSDVTLASHWAHNAYQYALYHRLPLDLCHH